MILSDDSQFRNAHIIFFLPSHKEMPFPFLAWKIASVIYSCWSDNPNHRYLRNRHFPADIYIAG